MKKIEEMTHEEIINLTHEEINRMYDYRCAENGVQILKAPTPLEVEDKPVPDLKVYETCGYATTDKELAEKFCGFMAEHLPKLKKIDYNWSVGSDYKYLKDMDRYDSKTEIEIKYCFSPEKYEAISKICKDATDKKSAYDKALKEYQESNNKRDEIVEDIRIDISAHRVLEDRLIAATTQRNQFVELAENNLEIARNFFKKISTNDALGVYIENKLFSDDIDPNELMRLQNEAIDYIRQCEL